jgi:hypothetical protein
MMDQDWLMDGFECRKPDATAFVDFTPKEGSRRKYIERGYIETVTCIFLDALDTEGGRPAEPPSPSPALFFSCMSLRQSHQVRTSILHDCGSYADHPSDNFSFTKLQNCTFLQR